MCRNRKTVSYMNNDYSNHATDDNDHTYDNHENSQTNDDDNKSE